MPIRLITLPLIALLALAGCETVKGAGQDIENAGEVVQDGAHELQSELN